MQKTIITVQIPIIESYSMNNQDIQLKYRKINEEIGSLPTFVTRMYIPGQSTFTFLIRLIIRAESSLIVL